MANFSKLSVLSAAGICLEKQQDILLVNLLLFLVSLNTYAMNIDATWYTTHDRSNALPT